MALEKKKLWQIFLMYFLFWLHPGAAPRQQCKTFDFVVLFNFCLMFFNCFKKIEDEKIVTFLLWLDPGAAPGQQCKAFDFVAFFEFFFLFFKKLETKKL